MTTLLTQQQLPSALDHLDDIVDSREPALFLDYDGTLTPIVRHPDDAFLSDAMRATLRRLGGLCHVSVISGRDLSDVRERIGIKSIWYAGNHGFDIAGPGGEHSENQAGLAYLPTLDAAEQHLRSKLTAIHGCFVERKRFSIVAHYRQVSQDDEKTVRQAVDKTITTYPTLRLTTGKKIFELQPAIDWNKGKALRWLMQTLDMDPGRFTPIYIGDDVTDEDAFHELATDGVGIRADHNDYPTNAAYCLDGPRAVEHFLNRLGNRLTRAQS